MTENMKKWMELVSQNEVLQKKLQNMADDTKDGSIAKMIGIAKENGITLTAEDFEAPQCEELSDDELDAVAGGGGCGCPVFGIGKGPGNYWCRCFIGGSGGITKSDGTYLNCFCPAVGGGRDVVIKSPKEK